VDGVYVKARPEKDEAAMLVVLAALHDGQKVILAVESGYRESTKSWAGILRNLKRRGLAAPKLVIGDGHLGIWGALTAVFPEAKVPRCWNHGLLNILDKPPLKRQAEARSLLTKIRMSRRARPPSGRSGPSRHGPPNAATPTPGARSTVIGTAW
jgi:putative transposase